MTDSVELTLPNVRPYFGVARLLVGGLAARLDLAYEQMDDLQLAVETVLLECRPAGATVTLQAAIGESELAVVVGPLSRPGGDARGDAGAVSFARLLETLVERSDVIERDGGTWLRLEQRIPPRTP